MVVAAFALWAALQSAEWPDWASGVLGAWLVLSPWILDFAVQRDRQEHPLEAFQREVNRLFDDFFRMPALSGDEGMFAAATPRRRQGDRRRVRGQRRAAPDLGPGRPRQLGR